MQDEDKSKEQLITELRELRKRVAELDLVGKRQVRTSATDITERAKQTREIEHLNRLYSVLSRVSQAVVRATSPETFLEQACREIVEAGGFLLAWIGQVELMTNAVVPKAFWGGIGEYVQGITVYADSRPEGLGPTGTCIREHYPVVHNDFLHDPQTLPWHDRAAPFGIASAAAFPIERAGGVWGALTIYSDEVDRFGGEDAKLLENVRARGAELREGLTALAAKFDFIREIRGEGLMIGVELSIEGAPFVAEALNRGLLINCTHDFTLRLLPPFIVTRAQVREFLRLFEMVLASTSKAESSPAPKKSEHSPRLAHSAAR